MALALSLLLLVCWGCGSKAEPTVSMPAAQSPSPEPQATAEAVVRPIPERTAEAISEDARLITDMAGREVRLPQRVTRVVALSPAGCETLFALGAEETLIGRSEDCVYPPEASDLPVYALAGEGDADRIISQRPDLVLVDGTDRREDAIARLEQAGIPVLVCGAETVADTYGSLRLLGRVFDAQEQAEGIVRAMEDAFALIQADPIAGGKTIYFELETASGLRTAGRGTFLNDVAEGMGLTNCFRDMEGWVDVTAAQVGERDPDFILVVTPYYGEGAAPEEELMCRDAWQGMKAVREMNVVAMPDNELSYAGPRLMDGAQMLYDFVVESLAAE